MRPHGATAFHVISLLVAIIALTSCLAEEALWTTHDIGDPPAGVPGSKDDSADTVGPPEALWQAATTNPATSVYRFDRSGAQLRQVGTLAEGVQVGVWGVDRRSGWVQISPWGQFASIHDVAFEVEPESTGEPEPIWQGTSTGDTEVLGLDSAGRLATLGVIPSGTPLGVYAIAYDEASDVGVVQSSPWIQLVDIHDVHIDGWTFPWEDEGGTHSSSGGYLATGLTGATIRVRAGRDLSPVSCADCLRVQGGHIVEADGRVFIGMGANLPLLRDGHMSGMDWSELSHRNVRVIRMFASGSHLSNDNGSPEDWVERIAARVDEAWSHDVRVIVAFADYYHPLPGEQLVADNYYRDDYNFCGIGDNPEIAVRPWPWYRRGVRTFDFQSACGNRPMLRGAPNYEVVYLPYVRAIVGRLREHPGVFAWAVGNEIRALGRGGAGEHAITQQEAVEHFASFLEHVIETIREVDGNHMIIPGVQNVTEVADQPADGEQWRMAFDRMLQVPFSVWNLTLYDQNSNSIADIAEFNRYGVPVIATEFDFWSCAYPELREATCGLMQGGLSMVAPWARDEMTNHCGAGPIESAWETFGWLGGTVFPDPAAGCGDLDPTPLPLP